jgi:Fe-S cluster assembly ATP-binding protein
MTNTDFLVINDLHVVLESNGDEILKGLSLTIKKGEFHAIMGKNGSGKTTLSKVLFGHPAYKITKGNIFLNGESIIEMTTDERARKGLFLAFQYPQEIPGVSLSNFLRTAINTRLEEENAEADEEKNRIDPFEFKQEIKKRMKLLKMDNSFATRHVNTGFSGGEKKRSEILQMALLNPKLAVLDEIDSGLDIDALKTVAEGINSIKNEDENKELSVLMITHYQRILNYIDKIDKIHVMMDGKIVLTGGHELAEQLETKGYDWVAESVLTV